MRTRFFFGPVTLQASLLRICFQKLRDVPIDTNPAEFSAAADAMCARFLFRGEQLPATGPAFRFSRLDDTPVDATPPRAFGTTALCVFP
jgi:hypothetical protein